MLRLRLLGTIRVERADGSEHVRLPGRSATLLLSRLALYPQRQHPREELIELLWPGVELHAGRNRLRQTLSTLRALLETPDAPLILADRQRLSLVPGALSSDVHELEAVAAHYHAFKQDRAPPFGVAPAAALVGGELLPGFFEDWVQMERHRLATLAEGVIEAQARFCTTTGMTVRLQGSAISTPKGPQLVAPPGLMALPRYLTRYFAPAGRLDSLAHELQHQTLLTIVGPGGVGKTRLAVEIAWRQQRESGWRCAYASLADASDETTIVRALEQALLPSPGGGWPAIEAALQSPRPVDLLVLDNAEQALGSVARLVQRLLEQQPHDQENGQFQRMPRLHLLVTSRHALELDGEMQLELAPLDDAALACELFVDRARAVRADFHASRDNREALHELVQALDGLPLALELAAARVRSFSPAQMLTQWRNAVAHEPLPGWLAARGHNRVLRHASVGALLDWSLRLLEPQARELLRDLAALTGPFALDDVLALGGTANALDDLVAHSLLQAVGETEPRYRLLGLPARAVRAGEPASALASARSRLRAALVDWADSLGQMAPIAAWAPRRTLARSLLDSAVDDGDADCALRLALALRPCWESDGVDAASVTVLGQLLKAKPGTRGHELRAHLAFTHGDRALALAECERALTLAPPDSAAEAAALTRRAWVLLAGDGAEQGQAEPLGRAVALARATGDKATEARAWQQLGAIAVAQVRPAVAEDYFERAQRLWEELGAGRQAGARLRNRAQCRIEQGDLSTAMDWVEQARLQAEADGDGLGMLDSAHTLAQIHERRRDWITALRAYQSALYMADARQHLHARALVLLAFGRPLAHLRQPREALLISAFAQLYWQRHLGAIVGREARALLRVQRLARRQLGSSPAEAAWAAGARASLPEILGLALQACA